MILGSGLAPSAVWHRGGRRWSRRLQWSCCRVL